MNRILKKYQEAILQAQEDYQATASQMLKDMALTTIYYSVKHIADYQMQEILKKRNKLHNYSRDEIRDKAYNIAARMIERIKCEGFVLTNPIGLVSYKSFAELYRKPKLETLYLDDVYPYYEDEEEL